MTIAQQLGIKKFPFEIRDKNGNLTYYENSGGFWEKREYDSNGNPIYYEDSDGDIIYNRPKVVELTHQQIADKFGIDINLLKIKP